MEGWEYGLRQHGRKLGKQLEPRIALLGVPTAWLTDVLHGRFPPATSSTVPSDLRILSLHQTDDMAYEGVVEFVVYSKTFDVWKPGDQMIDIAFRYEHKGAS